MHLVKLAARPHVLAHQLASAGTIFRGLTPIGSTTGSIYDWFATNLHRTREPSMRHYVRARELKAAGMEWTDVLAVEDENPRAGLAAEPCWPAPLTDSIRARGGRRLWPGGEDAGRRSSTTAGSSGAGAEAVMRLDSRFSKFENNALGHVNRPIKASAARRPDSAPPFM